MAQLSVEQFAWRQKDEGSREATQSATLLINQNFRPSAEVFARE